jgi:hypothetical protein
LSGVEIDDSEGGWFLFWEADCYSPPVTAIRAGSFESAYEIFIDDFATLIDDLDLADYDLESDDCRLHWSNRHPTNGWVDTESIDGCEALLIAIEPRK